jgi:hypothetical protein
MSAIIRIWIDGRVWQRYIQILLGLISVLWLHEESSIHSGEGITNIRLDFLTDNTGLRDP